jgi:mono/diheme cytochrome c family protein
MRVVLLLVGLMSCAGVSAQGKALHDAACLQCHASLTAGKPAHLYERLDRKVTTLAGLTKRVNYCAVAADVDWNKEQREAVVGYLNEQFYKF